MTGLDARFVSLTLLNEYFVDKDSGLPLANGKLEFYRDAARSTPKAVFQLSSSGGNYSYSTLTNQVDLNSVGTAQNSAGDNIAIYGFPYLNDPTSGNLELDLYYVVCKSSGGVEQWTREAIPNLTDVNNPINIFGGGGGGGGGFGGAGASGNQLSNPQFSRYFLLNDSTSLTVSAANTTFQIAPNWILEGSGSGTITVQRIPVEGDEAIPTFPAYYLKITPGAGVTNPILRQRLDKNSGLWSGKFVSGFFAAKANSASNSLTMKYKDSAGSTSNVTIFSALLTTSWASYGGSVEVEDSSNTQSGSSAHVDIELELPTEVATDITSIQVLPSDSEIFGTVSNYDERSANREQALMGDWYIPRLEEKRADSLLVGWDFSKNPSQFAGTSGTVSTNTAEYIWDQTILQTSVSASVDFSRTTPARDLSLNHTVADQSYALLQYLQGFEANVMVGDRLSVNVHGYTTDGGNSAQDTQVQVKLFANASNSQFGTLPTSLITLGTDGTMTLTSTAVSNGWYEITRSNLPVAKGSLSRLASGGDISNTADLKFNGWVIEDDTQANAGVGGFFIAVSFVPAASSTDYNTVLDSISLIPGDIPCRPSPIPFNNVLAACQRYYEKSYDHGNPVGTTSANAALVFQQLIEPEANSTSSAQRKLFSRAWGVSFKAEKWTANYTFTVYSPNTGAAGTIQPFIFNGGVAQSLSVTTISISGYTVSGKGSSSIIYVPAGVSALAATSGSITGNKAEAFIKLHYSVDARLGK